MAEGYTRAAPGNIGVCIGTSGPAGTDMITGLYSASADSIPILCITGQAPVAKLHKEDFQAVDIAAVAKPLTKMAVTVHGAGAGAGRLPAGVSPDAVRPPGAGADRPADRRPAGRDRVRPRHLRSRWRSSSPGDPRPDRAGARHARRGAAAADRRRRRGHQRRRRGAARRVRRADRRPGGPDADGLGHDPRRPSAQRRMVGLQTSRRYGNASMLAADFVLGIGNRWANRHTGGLDTYTAGRTFVHVDIEPTQIGRVFAPDYGIVSDAGAALELFVEAARERDLPDRSEWAEECGERKRTMLRKTNFDAVPIKPQRVYQEMNRAFGEDVRYVSTIGLSQIQAAQLLHVYRPRHWINAGQAGPLGWTVPAALGVATADPDATVVALSGDYDFQFMIEELAVGAQFNIPYIHVVVNNAYLGLIRQSQRGFDMDYCVQLSFDNVNSPGSTATASTTSRSPRAWAARRCGCSSPTRSCPRSSRPRS